jgi:hypothetical protein
MSTLFGLGFVTVIIGGTPCFNTVIMRQLSGVGVDSGQYKAGF